VAGIARPNVHGSKFLIRYPLRAKEGFQGGIASSLHERKLLGIPAVQTQIPHLRKMSSQLMMPSSAIDTEQNREID
jgi:hypothetical protein